MPLQRLTYFRNLSQYRGRFSCGNLLFAEDHHLSIVLVQKQNLTRESHIEKAYYNDKEKNLKLKDISIHCG